MGYKQLGLDQYKLHQLTEMDKIPTAEEVEFMLSDKELESRGQSKGTVQQQIADVEQHLSDEETIYLLNSKREVEYNNLEQTTLATGVSVERQQTEITGYDGGSRTSSD